MIVLVKRGDTGALRYCEYVLDSAADFGKLPVSSNDTGSPAIGSVAYTGDMSHIYLLGANNKWGEI